MRILDQAFFFMSIRLRCLLVCAAVAGCIVGPALSPCDVVAQTHSSPPGTSGRLPLDEAIIKFQDAWGLVLTYDPALLAGKQTRWAQPQHDDLEDDLRTLLQGTGLSFSRLSSGTYGIVEEKTPDQLYGSLGGHVLDKTTGLPLPRAHVLLQLIEPTGQGDATDATGLFLIPSLLPGEYIVVISHVGYEPQSRIVEIHPGQPTNLFVYLQIEPAPLPPILVEEEQEMKTPRALSGTLTGEELNQIKGLGTADAVRILNDLPGVRVGDAKADVHIQGGDPGEHLFLLDGGVIYEPVPLGFIGATSPFAIERITVNKAGFSASKGSYLAGVINAEHALTDSDQYPLDVQIDPLSFNARFNVSADVDEGVQADLMTAYRTSVWNGYWSDLRPPQIDNLLLAWNDSDPFLMRASLFPLNAVRPDLYKIFVQELDSLPPPGVPELGFNDLHVAGRLSFPNGSTYHASYYRGNNRLRGRRLVTAFDPTAQDLPNPDRYHWTNENAQFRWSFVPASTLFATMRLRSSSYRLNHEYSGLDRGNAQPIPAAFGRLLIRLTPADDGNRIREVALESTLDYDHPGGYLQTGLEVIYSQHRFTISDVFPRSIMHEASSWRAAFFAEDKLDITSRLRLTGGTRLTYLGSRATLYAEPRLELYYIPFSILSLRAAGGLYRQFLNQFDISTISPSSLFPSIRFWMPVDSSIAPPKAYHAAADVVLHLAEGWTFRAEG